MIFLNRRILGRTTRTRTFVTASKVIRTFMLWGIEAMLPLDSNFNSSRDFYLRNLYTRSLQPTFAITLVEFLRL